MPNLHPEICNLCNGKVVYTGNEKIYGRKYGSGMMYYCTSCGAYVGTHEPRPDEAYGILANQEMREMKRKCHDLFDESWLHENNRRKARKKAYQDLANKLDIPVEECHFGFFDMDMLQRVYGILKGGNNYELSDSKK